MIPRIITNTTVTIHLEGDIISANAQHPAFDQIREAALAQDWNQVRTLTNVSEAIKVWSDNEFEINDDQVLYNGTPVPSELEKRILAFVESKVDFSHLLTFYRKLIKNPSRRSVQQLYKFLEHESIPIGEDGCFYAYKAVRQDWMSYGADRRTGERQLNKIGMTPTMPRNEVDDDPTRGCSYGFHVGSLAYASGFGGGGSKLLICRISPENVVSVPHDCAHQKLRCSSYTVVQEYVGPLPDTFWSPNQPDYDDGVFENSPTDTRIASIQAEMEESEDQLERLQTALEAAEDAEVGQTVLNGLLNAMTDVEGILQRLETDLASLNEPYEG